MVISLLSYLQDLCPSKNVVSVLKKKKLHPENAVTLGGLPR